MLDHDFVLNAAAPADVDGDGDLDLVVGEVAAELAHEIRNPLAGIQIAFSNLRREINNPEQNARMELIGNELKRLGHLLNDLLNQSRHAPEAADDIDIAMLIRDLAALTRYQIAEDIRLEVD
ncbi:MAG: histidine kinase dimerization/phospho-acceptor domain-containing protein, partial [Gammaproteobacteria bacterium]